MFIIYSNRNLYLLCGDASLELIGKSLEYKREQHSSLSQYGPNAWRAVTNCLKQFIKRIAERKGIKLVVFIDMNSTFSVLTEIALTACEKILIPVSEDQLHRNSFEYMFALLYGFSMPSNVYYYYRHFSFYYKANQHEIKLPKIHLIIKQIKKNNNKAEALCKTTNLLTINDNSSSYNLFNNNDDNNNNNNNSNLEWSFIFELFKKYPQTFNISKQNFVLKLFI
jgi:hypothetical protein